MKTFTIDNEKNITAHATPEEAAATATPFDSFASQKELADLAKAWPTDRLVAIWNSLPGVVGPSRHQGRQRYLGEADLEARPGIG